MVPARGGLLATDRQHCAFECPDLGVGLGLEGFDVPPSADAPDARVRPVTVVTVVEPLAMTYNLLLMNVSATVVPASQMLLVRSAAMAWISVMRTDRRADQEIGKIDQRADQGTGKNGHFAQH